GKVLAFDRPWEGIYCGYCTVIYDEKADLQRGKYRVYYRGMPAGSTDGSAKEVTCIAFSQDGIRWQKPELGLFEINGSKDNNVVWAGDPPFSHNFSPFIDTRPDCPPEQRYKALSGLDKTGLVAFVSPDGLHWKKLRQEAVIPRKTPFKVTWMFDSQNVAFWSESERKYLSYFRVYTGVRRIARSESTDFVHWSEPVLMEYENDGQKAPVEELYTNQTSPYFRAPHLYVSVAARFVPGRQAISDAEAAELQVAKNYYKDLSDAVLMTSRGGNVYERTFLSSFIRPGIGLRNWVSRTNYPALGIVQTGLHAMSIYVNQDYAQPTSHLHRYSLRLDGFASVRAEYGGGELLTKLLRFSGTSLQLNLSTSAVGLIEVEIQDESGKPIPGFSADDCVEVIGNETDRTVRWKSGSDLSELVDKPVRLRFIMKDADLYAFRFAAPDPREKCLTILRKGMEADEFWPAMHAAEALTQAGQGDEVISQLRDRLPGERDDQHRCGLARELVRAGDRCALSVLFEILGDADSNGRNHAAESLYKIGEVGDGKLMREALAQSANPALQLWAAAALVKSGDDEPRELLRKQLRSDDREIRNLVAFILSRIGTQEDAAALNQTLQRETDATARARLICALASIGDAKARDELKRNLTSEDAAIRTMSAECAGPGGCWNCEPQLRRLLDDETLDVRVRAAHALIMLNRNEQQRWKQ
ncbi:MAG: HEAT repeat domain-containing protein, partial [Aureliella sp.]